MGWRKTVEVFIPRWRAREEELDDDTCNVHVSEAASKDGGDAGRAKDEEEDGADDGSAVMHDAVG